MKSIIRAALIVTFLAAPLTAAPVTADALGWMSGHWMGTIDGVTMEEVWLKPAGGLMTGMHRDLRNGRATSFEFFRIAETTTGLTYLTQPGGRPAVAFPMIESSASRVVFANPEHDFPTRIIYWLDGAQLCARIEGVMDGKEAGEQWCWSRRTETGEK